MTDTTEQTEQTEQDDDVYLPDFELVKKLAGRVREEHGKSARLYEVARHLDEWPETRDLDLGQQELLVEEIVEVLAACDNGFRR